MDPMLTRSSVLLKSPANRKLLTGLALMVVFLGACTRSPQQKEAAFLEDGKKHLAGKDFARAIIDFRNAIQAMPKDAEPHYQIGLADLGSGNAQAAAGELLQATQLDPKHVAAQLKLAELMTANQNPDVVKEGQKKAQDVLVLSPGNPDALETLAVSELRLGDPADAVQHLDQALHNAPQNLNAATTLALTKLRNNDVVGAEQVMRKAVTDAPRSAEHAVAFGSFYALIRRPADAETQFRRALDINPKFGPALVALGNSLYQAGKLEEAGQLFQQASSLPNKEYWPLHAIFLLQTGKGDQAIAEFAQQYKSDQQDREARSRLVSAYVRLGRTADAERVLGETLKRNSKDTDALMQRGELNLAARKIDQAQADLNQVLQFRPDSPEAHLLMARIDQVRNDRSSQIHELNEALRLNPKLLAARVELAYAFTDNNSPKSAIDLLAQAPAADQHKVPLIIERNAALYALGDYAEARKGIDQGLLISRHPTLLLQDGLLRLKDGDYKGSRAPLEEALKQRPQDWKAVNALALTYLAEKKKTEATAIVRQYTSQAPQSAQGQQFLGTWLANNGDLTGADAAFQKAKSLDPKSTGADFGLARLPWPKGNSIPPAIASPTS